MVFKRIMTGVVALIVTGFSLSVFAMLWKLNGFEPDLTGIVCSASMLRWESKEYVSEIYVEEGVFEQLILYRKATDDCIA